MVNSVNDVVPSTVGSLILVLDGASFEVSSYVSQWAINEIPSCTLDLAIGIEALSQKLAGVHGAGGALKMRTKARVILDIRGQKNAKNQWPGGQQVIFEGYIHSVQPSRSTRQVSIQVTLYHWLSDLNTSHFGFGRLAPGTPWALFKERPSTAAFGITDILHRGPNPDDYVKNEEIFDKDLYDLFMEGMRFSLTDVDSVLQFRTVDGVKPAAFHESCLAALDRVENLGCKLSQSVGVMSSDNPLDPRRINEMMGAIAHNAAGGSTAWTKILAFLNMFDLHLVPAVDGAFVAPKLAGSTNHAIDIPNTEIDLGGGAGFQTNLPRGVVILPNRSSVSAMGTIPGGCNGINTYVLGQYVLPPGTSGTSLVGAIEVVPTPAIFGKEFMGKPKDSQNKAKKSTQQQPDSEPILGVKPGTIDCPPTTAFGDRWCESFYWNYVFSNRVQTIDSTLRFDITPGTIIKVDITHASTGRSAVGNIPGYEGNTLYGVVEKLMYQISSEQKTMSTQLMVRYVKSEDDKDSYEQTANANNHPLFDTYYGHSGLQKPLHDVLGA